MAEEVVRVTTRYRVESRGAEKRAERLARKADQYAREASKAERLTSRWSSSLKGLAVGAASAGVGLLSRQLLNLQREAENADVKIAGIFSTLNPDQGFLRSLDRARNLMGKFRDASIKSPATSAQFQEVFQEAAPALGGMGLSNDKLSQFISRAVPAALAFSGGDYGQAGRDINQLLSGNFGTDNRTFNPMRKRLLALTGAKDTSQFNAIAKADPARVFSAVEKVLEQMDDVNSAYAGMFDGLISSSTEYLTRFGKAFTSDVYERIKGELADLVQWFEQNEKMVTAVADAVGKRLGDAFGLLARLTRMILNNMEGIAVIAGILAAKKLGGIAAASAAGGGLARFGGGVSALASGAAYTNVFGGARAAGSRAAGAIAGTAGKLKSGVARAALAPVSIAGDLMFGRMLGSQRSRDAALMRTGGQKAAHTAGTVASGLGLKSLFGGLAGAAGVLIKVLAPLVVIVGMVAGTFRVLKDRANEATVFLRLSIDELMIVLDTIAIQFGQGGGFVDAMKKFADWLGTGVVGTVGFAVKAIEQLVQAISWMVAAFKGAAYGIGSVMDLVDKQGFTALADTEKVGRLLSEGMEKAFEERSQAERDVYRKRAKEDSDREYAEIADKRLKELEEKKSQDAAALGASRPRIDITIKQEIKTDADPDRIAFQTGEVIKKVISTSRDTSVRRLTGLERG